MLTGDRRRRSSWRPLELLERRLGSVPIGGRGCQAGGRAVKLPLLAVQVHLELPALLVKVLQVRRGLRQGRLPGLEAGLQRGCICFCRE